MRLYLFKEETKVMFSEETRVGHENKQYKFLAVHLAYV